MCEALDRFKSVTTDFIDSASSMLSMCACYLYYNKIIKKKSDIMVYQLQSYVDANFRENITVSTLCRKFFISKSKLYSLSKSAFGMGVSDYIRHKRLEEAKKLLKDTDKSVNAIAENIGFLDTNYFIRIFKKDVGITPNKYRKNEQF